MKTEMYVYCTLLVNIFPILKKNPTLQYFFKEKKVQYYKICYYKTSENTMYF